MAFPLNKDVVLVRHLFCAVRSLKGSVSFHFWV